MGKCLEGKAQTSLTTTFGGYFVPTSIPSVFSSHSPLLTPACQLSIKSQCYSSTGSIKLWLDNAIIRHWEKVDFLSYSLSLVYFVYGDVGRICIMLTSEYSRLTMPIITQSSFRQGALSQNNYIRISGMILYAMGLRTTPQIMSFRNPLCFVCRSTVIGMQFGEQFFSMPII